MTRSNVPSQELVPTDISISAEVTSDVFVNSVKGANSSPGYFLFAVLKLKALTLAMAATLKISDTALASQSCTECALE